MRTEDNMDLTPEEIKKYKTILLDFVPNNGKTIGNMNARTQLIGQIKNDFGKIICDDDYWTIRNSLMDDGIITKGPGKGGSIYRVNQKQDEPSIAKKDKESDLYPLVHKTIIESWVKEYQIGDFLSQITATAGKRDGGTWTRPDISLFAFRTYPYIPGKKIELITFEIKPKHISQGKYVAGVFETASHSAFAHRSYLMVHVSKELDKETDPLLDRLEKEAQRMRIGFVTFEDARDWATYDVKVEAVLQEPDPVTFCKFIKEQFSEENKEKIQAKK